MARIELDLAHAYKPNPQRDEDYALLPLKMSFVDGGAYALLGPSGCGKSTLLNAMSGLLQPSRGRILLDGRDVTNVTPRERNIAQVFQFPVVYDTMTVGENLAFPLRNRGVGEPEVRARVQEIAELLELTADLPRRAQGLPVDVKQRLSLARGLVRKDVAAILLDEPLTVVDPQIKWQLRRHLKKVHQQLSVTLVYVTHDQVEALTLADRVVVMDAGRVVQQGTPQELFENPAHPFVGRFIGSPGMNLLPCRIEDGAAIVAGQRVSFVGSAPAAAAHVLGIRPEFVRVGPGVRAERVSLEDHGNHRLLTAKLGDARVLAKLPPDTAIPPGELSLTFPPERVRIFAA